MAGAEGQEALCVHRPVVHCHGPQTPQEAFCVSHSVQVDHPAAVLQDAFAAVDFEAAWTVCRAQGRQRRSRKHAKTDGQSEEACWSFHADEVATARNGEDLCAVGEPNSCQHCDSRKVIRVKVTGILGIAFCSAHRLSHI